MCMSSWAYGANGKPNPFHFDLLLWMPQVARSLNSNVVVVVVIFCVFSSSSFVSALGTQRVHLRLETWDVIIDLILLWNPGNHKI